MSTDFNQDNLEILLSVIYVAGTVLGTGDRVLNRMVTIHTLRKGT